MSARLASVLAFVCTLAVPAGACAQEAWHIQDSGRSLVLPGTLDLEVIDGSIIPADCQLRRYARYIEANNLLTECVAAPLAQSEFELQDSYVRALASRGWRFAGGAANVFFFERPRTGEDCSDRLALVGLLLGDPAETDKYGTEEEGSMNWSRVTHGAFLFALEPAPVCGDERDAQ